MTGARSTGVGKAGTSFGNFVFLGLRANSGIRRHNDIDLYLNGEDDLQCLTDYNCSFVFQNSTLCSATCRLANVPVHHPADCREFRVFIDL
jgi:hypothetical protein